ncbi:protein of unknown function (plasmid) [Pararobbsia alpina]|uniref:hypothetical protein n=1 Tax=Pararobbsia alpina TaxID=621374 RepID=UPI0039A74410
MNAQRDFSYRSLVIRISLEKLDRNWVFEAHVGRSKCDGFSVVVESFIKTFDRAVDVHEALELVLRRAQIQADVVLNVLPPYRRVGLRANVMGERSCLARPIGWRLC